MIVVMFESAMAQKALSKPALTTAWFDLPRRISSFMRSKISTLASTAMPTFSTSPAIADRVRVKLNTESTETMKYRFRSWAMIAFRPALR